MDNNKIMKPVGGQPSWTNRKRVIFGTLYFCATCVVYILLASTFMAAVPEIFTTIASALITLAGAVIGTYVAGASWSDISTQRIIVDQSNKNNKDDEPEYLPNLAEGKGLED